MKEKLLQEGPVFAICIYKGRSPRETGKVFEGTPSPSLSYLANISTFFHHLFCSISFKGCIAGLKRLLETLNLLLFLGLICPKPFEDIHLRVLVELKRENMNFLADAIYLGRSRSGLAKE